MFTYYSYFLFYQSNPISFPPVQRPQLTDLFIRNVHRRDFEVREIYANLRDVLLLQVPPDGLAALQTSWLVGTAALLSEVQSNPLVL